MADRPRLRVVQGGACPPSMRPGVVRAIDVRLRGIVRDLEMLATSARHDLDDEELGEAIARATVDVNLARLVLERRKTT